MPSEGKVFVNAKFTFVNDSTAALMISFTSFSTTVDDAVLDQSLTGYYLMTKNGETSFDTAQNILAGKQLTGWVSYEVPSDWQKMDISFVLNEWSQKKVRFVINRDQVTVKQNSAGETS